MLGAAVLKLQVLDEVQTNATVIRLVFESERMSRMTSMPS